MIGADLPWLPARDGHIAALDSAEHLLDMADRIQHPLRADIEHQHRCVPSPRYARGCALRHTSISRASSTEV